MDDLISRQAVMNCFHDWIDKRGDIHTPDEMAEYRAIEALPSEQPEITDEQAILHLQSTGWMQNHDREMYESGLRERRADDSGSYDSIISCKDTISRQAAIDALCKRCDLAAEDDEPCTEKCNDIKMLEKLPSAHPEIIRCKDCKYKEVYCFPPKYNKRDYCEKHEKTVDVADFCSWAERRTDERAEID